MHTHIYTHIGMCMYLCVYVCVCVCVRARARVHECAHIFLEELLKLFRSLNNSSKKHVTKIDLFIT